MGPARLAGDPRQPLVIPIDDGFLYVEPVYLRAEGNDIPQLKRVIVSDGNSVAMEETLEEAIKVVFGGGAAQQAAPASTVGFRPMCNEPGTRCMRRSPRWAGATGRHSAGRCNN